MYFCAVCFIPVASCRSYCVKRSMATENQSSSECGVSPLGSHSNQTSLTISGEDSIHANCCSSGTPLPRVSWEFCTANSTECTSLTNATQSLAELKVTGNDLVAGDGSVRCVAKYLDVTEDLWTIPLYVVKTPDGKTQDIWMWQRLHRSWTIFVALCLQFVNLCCMHRKVVFCVANEHI